MLPNLLSLSRIPLSFFLLWPHIPFRLFIVGAACLSDILDGALARRWNLSSKWGAILDPVGDKWFALFSLSILYSEEKLTRWGLVLFLSREIALLTFSLLLLLQKKWKNYTVRAFYSGKGATSLQFAAFLLLFAGFELPPFFYPLFAILGCTSLLELLLRDFRGFPPKNPTKGVEPL